MPPKCANSSTESLYTSKHLASDITYDKSHKFLGLAGKCGFKAILSIHTALQYVAKYASTIIISLFGCIASNPYIAKWDITDCPRNLPYSSQVFLNLNKEVPRWIYGTGKSEESYSFNNLG
uniref:Uncharacterized protein n=1 Tax=Rhizophagus irregularis (strain DAOM 181602 / DAOM 197198 / MUCL 43194) TaxID=747089 RepID=U9T6X2_RHIID